MVLDYLERGIVGKHRKADEGVWYTQRIMKHETSDIIQAGRDTECYWCTHWYARGRRLCPNCKKPNLDYVDKSNRFTAHPSDTQIKVMKQSESKLVVLKASDPTGTGIDSV